MRKLIRKGFTLVELMLVVAIIAILAMLAIPAYDDFSVRTKVSELLLEAGKFRSVIAEKSAQDGGTLASAGVGLTVVPGGKISGGSITDDGIITIAGDATTLGVAVAVTLTPTIQPDGKIIWTCSTAAATYKFVPADCRN